MYSYIWKQSIKGTPYYWDSLCKCVMSSYFTIIHQTLLSFVCRCLSLGSSTKHTFPHFEYYAQRCAQPGAWFPDLCAHIKCETLIMRGIMRDIMRGSQILCAAVCAARGLVSRPPLILCAHSKSEYLIMRGIMRDVMRGGQILCAEVCAARDWLPDRP